MYSKTDSRQFILNEDEFFRAFPKRPRSAHKGSTGKILLISGSFGMAGAACLNILGARALGAPYINVMLPEEIYPIVASRFMEPVFYPFRTDDFQAVFEKASEGCRALAFGSGAVHNPCKQEILDLILNSSSIPSVLDAEALNLLKGKEEQLRNAKAPVIITPHPGEFKHFTDKTAKMTAADPAEAALQCSALYNVITVLKSHETAAASPDGRVYRNSSGNQGLAQAGSGDVLTGMTAAMLSFIEDPFKAACMAVFAHGIAADELCRNHSHQLMPLEEIPQAMDRLFMKHGF